MNNKNHNMPGIGKFKMAGENSIYLNYTLFLQRCWKKEIERAIKEVKNSGKHTELDKWFRRRWYIAQAIDRKRSLRTGQLARW